MSTTDTKRTCDLCDEPAIDRIDVEKEGTDEMATANLCETHLDKTERYTAGEDVDWEIDT